MIPAMTSDAEREMFRRFAEEQAHRGAIVELGAWLGAGTHAIASGIKASGATNVVHSFDRFKWNPRTHPPKAGGLQVHDLHLEHKKNLISLSEYVKSYKCEIENVRWTGGPISLLVSDGPKRWAPVQHVLKEFGPHLQPGTTMVWQDFCFPPAYAIPASLYLLRDHFKYCDAVDFTVVLTVTERWEARDVMDEKWHPDEVMKSLDYWESLLPKQCYAGVACGAAMLLSDLGKTKLGRTVLEQSDAAPVNRLKKTHSIIVRRRYQDLFSGF